MYRGFFLKYVFTKHQIIGVLMSTIIFVLIHAPNDLLSWAYFGIPGLVFAFSYLYTRRLETAALIHIITNIAAGFVLLK